MYPLKEGCFAPRNQWYVAAWSKEVMRTPMERWILNEPVAFYRKENGDPVALDGRCPHRLYPLGRSHVVGDNIVCDYHGIAFRPDGLCADIPSQKSIPNACSVKSYPIVEMWDWIWIWPGDPALADKDMIPDHFELGVSNPAYKTFSGWHQIIPGRYMLMHDNLLDLSHVHHLHRATVGPGQLTPTTVTQGPGWISTQFEHRDVEIPEFSARSYQYSGRIDRFTEIKFLFPSLHLPIDEMRKPVPPDQGQGELIGRTHHYHVITPATLDSCHYFFGGATPADHPDPEFYRTSIEAVYATLEEDIRATVNIEAMLDRHSTPREILLRADAACVSGRRMFEDAILAEQAGHRYPPRDSN